MIRKIALSLGIAEEELLAQAHGRSKTGDALLDSGGQERAILDAFRQIRDPRTRGYVVSLLQSLAER